MEREVIMIKIRGRQVGGILIPNPASEDWPIYIPKPADLQDSEPYWRRRRGPIEWAEAMTTPKAKPVGVCSAEAAHYLEIQRRR